MQRSLNSVSESSEGKHRFFASEYQSLERLNDGRWIESTAIT